jgi:hypothetical protein
MAALMGDFPPGAPIWSDGVQLPKSELPSAAANGLVPASPVEGMR